MYAVCVSNFGWVSGVASASDSPDKSILRAFYQSTGSAWKIHGAVGGLAA